MNRLHKAGLEILDRHPYINNPALLSNTILNCEKIGTDDFTIRLPKLLYPGLNYQFDEWQRENHPNIGKFLNTLGFYTENLGLKTGLLADVSPFHLWYSYKKDDDYEKHEKRIYLPEFESKIATQLSHFFLDKIANAKFDENNLSELAGLITGAQLVSTNLINAPDYAEQYILEKYRKLMSYQLFNYYPNFANDIFSQFDNTKNPIVSLNVFQLYFNHLKAFFDGFESSTLLPKKLLQAFFELIGNMKSQTGYNKGYFHVEEEEFLTPEKVKRLLLKLHQDEKKYYPDEDKEVQFAGRYLIGLRQVAKEMVSGEENGVLYIYDHLKRIIENNDLLPQEDLNGVDVIKWKEILLQLLKDPNLFDFLHGDNKVREIIGRYDYRPLLDYFKSNGKNKLSAIILGFGKLGAATWEMENIFKDNGITMDITGVDRLTLKKIADSNQYLVQKIKRNRLGVFTDENNDGMPDIDALSQDETGDLISWYNQLFNNDKLVSDIDLVEKSPDLPKADLVTLQGTVACLGKYDERVKMIENALKLVNPEGGVLLIEGGMTLTGGQNINSIALRLNNGKVEILYIEINRSRGAIVPSSYTSSQRTLLVNKDIFPGNNIPQGENYYPVSFSDGREIIPALFQAINNEKLVSQKI